MPNPKRKSKRRYTVQPTSARRVKADWFSADPHPVLKGLLASLSAEDKKELALYIDDRRLDVEQENLL